MTPRDVELIEAVKNCFREDCSPTRQQQKENRVIRSVNSKARDIQGDGMRSITPFAKFTRLTATQPSIVTKTFSLLFGNLNKTTIADVYAGHVAHVEVTDLTALAAVLAEFPLLSAWFTASHPVHPWNL